MMNQTKKHTTGKKLLALLLALIMTVSLLPMSVFAADLGTEAPIVEGQTQQDTEPVQELDVEDEGDADVQNMEGGAAVYADAAQINYVEKTQSVPLKDGTFYRIVHIDCGRKYFSVDELKKIIDYAAASNYTHVELAFGNDGLRFLLDDMEVTASGVTYASEAVKSAIQAGNKAFYDAGTNELTQTQMNDIISYANGKGIGIIPMFDAPGHLQTVVRAMATLGVAANKYTTPTTSGTSVNYAIDPTDATSVNFVQALMQKYITYFAGKGCTMFNIAADECGFTKMATDTYTAYAKMVNSMAAMVQNAGMTALAFNDGIYHKNLTTSVKFDTNIAVCYWDASSDKYAPAADLATEGFKIINTNNKWYYVLGSEGTGWFGYQWAQGYMKGSNKDCRLVDGDYYTDAGCMLALWCDTPSADVNWTNVENHIKTLAENNSTYFTKVEVPEEVELPAVNDPETNVSVVVKGQEGQTAAVTVVAKDARTEGLPDSAKEAVSYEITPSVNNAAYAGVGKVTLPVPAEWKDNTDRVRGYIVTDGNVETIQGSYDADSGKYTFAVPHFSEMGLILLAEEVSDRVIELVVGQEKTEFFEGVTYVDGMSLTTENEAVSTVTAVADASQQGGSEFVPVSSVSSNGTYVIKDSTTGKFLKRSSTSVTWVDTVDEATEWTVSSDSGYSTYTLSDGSYYLTSDYSGDWSVSTQWWNAASLYFNNGTFYRSRSQSYGGYYYYNELGAVGQKKDSAPVTGINVTFKGVTAGTTYVTIDGVKYKIVVSKEDLSKATDLPIQTWITNNIIKFDGSTQTSDVFGGSTYKYAYYLKIKATAAEGTESVNSDKGMALSQLVPALQDKMWEYDNVYFPENSRPTSDWSEKTAKTLSLFQGVLLKSGDGNQYKVSTDKSNSGTAFQYVRYLNGIWEVSSDRVSWVEVGTDLSKTTNAYSSSGTQVIAYYMMRTEITDEIKTDVADWGYVKGDKEYDSQIKGDYVLLDFRIKYTDGGLVDPKTFPQDGKTFLFHCNEGSGGVVGTGSDRYRQLNNFRGVNTSEYEIYMVTVTMTSDDAATTINDTTGYEHNGEEQIVWAIDEKARTDSQLNDYVSISGANSDYSGCKIGGSPYVRGVEVYNQHGALITYYVRKIAKPGDLTVRYFDVTSGTPSQFHEYSIGVKDVEKDRFNSNIRLDNPWKQNLLYGNVTNDWGKEVWVSADLSTMYSIDPKYRYATDYNCVDVKWEKEGKEVWLYYTFKSDVTFVADFGLPLVIQPKDISAQLAADGVTIEETTITQQPKFGAVTTTPEDKGKLTYTLNQMLDGVDNFKVQYAGSLLVEGNDTPQEGETGEYSIRIIPASTVYYEDDETFVQFSKEWTIEGTSSTANQALDKLSDASANNYGFDKAYENNQSTLFSMGSAHKVTVRSNDTTAPNATFTFTGTGFDLVSLTSNATGTILVDVYQGDKAAGTAYKNWIVDTFYGYTREEDGFLKNTWTYGTDNKWHVTQEKVATAGTSETQPTNPVAGESRYVTYEPNYIWKVTEGDNALYQIPVIHYTDLPYATYTVVIRPKYYSMFDHTTQGGSYDFYLDAVRIYNPMGTNGNTYYVEDGEGYATFTEVRNLLLDAGDLTAGIAELGGVVFVDGKPGANITDYKNYGPNNEVYLSGGQAIAFKVENAENVASIQLGAKVPNGASATLNWATSEGEKRGSIPLTTATDMYYKLEDISDGDIVVIANGSSENGVLLSLTTLKITYNAKPTPENSAQIVVDGDVVNEAPVMLTAMLNTQPEPDPEPEVFVPERFEASWNRSSVKVGQKATLTVKTSTDVDTITVDGVTVTNYRTRTQRTGWGWNATKVTYREFTYTITAAEVGTLDYSVVAINADGVNSEPVTAALTVQAAAQRPGFGGWLENIFGRWF